MTMTSGSRLLSCLYIVSLSFEMGDHSGQAIISTREHGDFYALVVSEY